MAVEIIQEPVRGPAAPQPAPDAGPAIAVRDVGKMYRIYDRPQDRLKQMLLWRFGRHYGREFWALRGVSLEVQRGETVGIIGRNGSGKSTLLQIIAGTLTPTEGEVGVRGRVAALLELGSGFNPEFTGRENVFMNGTILGLSRAEMEARFDEIAAFADIGEFIEQPVKLYSSGMVVRLAFAVASCVEPDILIVDEALAVGDVAFQARCLDKIKRLTDGGATTLFVTHDIGTFQNLCQRGYMLDGGRLFAQGRPAQVAMQYYEVMRVSEHARQRDEATGAGRGAEAREELQAQLEEIRAKDQEGEYRFGTGGARIVDYVVRDADGAETASLQVGRPFTVTARVRADERIENLAIGVMFRNAQGQNLMGMHSYHEHRVSFGLLQPGQELEITCAQEMLLNPGDYLLSIGIADCRSDYDYTNLDSRSNLAKVSVVGKALAYGVIHTAPAFSVGGERPRAPGPPFDRSPLSYTLAEVKAAYEALLAGPELQEVVGEILRHDSSSTDARLIASGAEEERAWPSDPRFVASGYHRMMLGRYAFAGATFCRGAEVLDTCCGLGWGAYLVAHYARGVTAFDLNPRLVEFCRGAWPARSIDWRAGDATELAFLGDRRYDVALGMEVIEHFTQEGGERYVAEVAGALRPGGVFVGTSAFPASRDEARAMEAQNPYHLHICTEAEMLALLREHFSEAAIIGGWMFIAVR